MRRLMHSPCTLIFGRSSTWPICQESRPAKLVAPSTPVLVHVQLLRPAPLIENFSVDHDPNFWGEFEERWWKLIIGLVCLPSPRRSWDSHEGKFFSLESTDPLHDPRKWIHTYSASSNAALRCRSLLPRWELSICCYIREVSLAGWTGLGRVY
jgi:hypothetical protein